MNRTIKNVLCMIIIVLTFFSTLITVNYLNKQVSYVNEHNKKVMQVRKEQKDAKEQSHDNNLKKEFVDKKLWVLLFFEILIMVLVITYLIMSMYNHRNFKDVFDGIDKILLISLIGVVFTILVMFLIGNFCYRNNLDNAKKIVKEKDHTKIKLDKTNIVNDTFIDLSSYDNDITINKNGEYTLSGEFNHSVIVDAPKNDEVKLILDNVDIKSSKTATIIALSGEKLIINVNKNSINYLEDNGNSTYDGCIYSDIPLYFEGEGELNIKGNQVDGEGIATKNQNITFDGGTYIISSLDDGINAGGNGASIIINDGIFYIDAKGDGIDSNKDAIINGGIVFVMGSEYGNNSAIDTDDGYQINGGLVIALGMDMLENPLVSSKQKYLSYVLDDVIDENVIVSLMKNDKEIVSFQSQKIFKTIIISTDLLEDGTYSLYKEGSHTGVLDKGIYIGGKYIKGTQINKEDIVYE